jgi:hypothetical protein
MQLTGPTSWRPVCHHSIRPRQLILDVRLLLVTELSATKAVRRLV